MIFSTLEYKRISISRIQTDKLFWKVELEVRQAFNIHFIKIINAEFTW